MTEIDNKYEVYQDEEGEYRWRTKALNGEIIAISGEGFTRRSDAVRALRRAYPDVKVVHQPQAPDE